MWTVNDDNLSITTDGLKAYFLAKLTQPTAFVLDEYNLLGIVIVVGVVVVVSLIYVWLLRHGWRMDGWG